MRMHLENTALFRVLRGNGMSPWMKFNLFVCLKKCQYDDINRCLLFLSSRCQIQIYFITKGNLLIQVGQGY